MNADSRARALLAGLLQLGVGIACVVAAVAAWRVLLYPAVRAALPAGSSGGWLVGPLGAFLAVTAGYALFVRAYERRPATELRLRGGALLACAAAGAASIGATILVLAASGHYQVLSYRGFGRAGDVLAQIGAAAVLEEVAFRALLFRILEERLGSRAAVAISALVFTLGHLENAGVGAITVLTVALAGVMWAALYALTRNVWATAAHHACWNATIFASGLPLSGEEAWRAQAPIVSAARGPALWTGGAFGPEDSWVNVVLCCAICVVLWQLARRADPSFPRAAAAPPRDQAPEVPPS